MKEATILRLEALRFTMDALNAGRISSTHVTEYATTLHAFLVAKPAAKKRGK